MKSITLAGQVLDEQIELTVIEITDVCSLSMNQVVDLVQEGVLDPIGNEPENWRFRGTSVGKALAAMRLQADLGVNLAGVALALDLLEEIEILRSRLRLYESEPIT